MGTDQPTYSIVDGMWHFEYGDVVRDFKRLGIIFDSGAPGDVLMKHGEYEKLEQLYTSEKYLCISRVEGIELVLMEVPVDFVDDVNKCVNISATRLLTKLMNKIKSLPVPVESNDDSVMGV